MSPDPRDPDSPVRTTAAVDPSGAPAGPGGGAVAVDEVDVLDPAEEEALRAEIDAELAAERRARRRAPDRLTGAVLVIGSLVGWIASVILFMERLFLAANPGAKLSCDISPFVSCGGVMQSWQANTFYIPNMAVGLGGFAIMGAVGSLLLSRAVLPRWFRWASLGGTTFAFAFVHWLAINAIFILGKLCLWCMVVWTATAPMFFVNLAHAIEDGQLRLPAPVARVLRHWVVCTLLWYLLVILVIAVIFGRRFLAWWGML
ncbi:vitamin K epoxide reductase family protein [Brachybacterium sp. EF45031]|uniref:vitamin K epoxide reductase family protein n=1 Tax=Brachybacterium sillae TaxID=2810536 RepID=UPI00217DE882|nr:vitamin K epoxide reductase family protein [Brachybacterium sillae]MCS6710785.1 vitamin K epoxide reductase family protein [Brachybacterium sillae]